jgi:hypothetical protein
MTLSWGEAKGVQTSQKKEVERIKLDGTVKFRLVGDVLPRYVYWVVTTEGKKFPVECLEFIRDTEKLDPTQKNPFSEIPQEIYKDKPQFAYVCNVIDRADGKVKLLDLKSTVYKQIIALAQDPEYGNPADPVTGYDISIKKEKTGNLPQNVKYTCTPRPGTKPLTEEEKALQLYDLGVMFKRPTYLEQKEWLIKNTTYFVGAVGAEGKVESAEDLA